MNVFPKERFLRLTPEEKQKLAGYVAGPDDKYWCFSKNEKALYDKVCADINPNENRAKIDVEGIVLRYAGNPAQSRPARKTRKVAKNQKKSKKQPTQAMLKVLNNVEDLKGQDIKEVLKSILKDLGYAE